jgi:hypothetical protein
MKKSTVIILLTSISDALIDFQIDTSFMSIVYYMTPIIDLYHFWSFVLYLSLSSSQSTISIDSK